MSHQYIVLCPKFYLISSYLRPDQDAEGAEVPPEGLGGLVQPFRQVADGRGLYFDMHFFSHWPRSSFPFETSFSMAKLFNPIHFSQHSTINSPTVNKFNGAASQTNCRWPRFSFSFCSLFFLLELKQYKCCDPRSNYIFGFFPRTPWQQFERSGERWWTA